jgi:hypothetical protein
LFSRCSLRRFASLSLSSLPLLVDQQTWNFCNSKNTKEHLNLWQPYLLG